MSEDTFERYACDELDAAARATVEAHAAACPDCGRVLSGLKMLRQEAREFDSGAPGEARSARRRWVMPAAVAACLAVAVLTPIAWKALRTPASTVRTASRAAIQLVAPRDTLHAAPVRFAWQPVDGATRYDVRLFTPDGTLIWTTTTDAASADLPPSVSLSPGRYFWQVRATRGTAAESELLPFVIESR